METFYTILLMILGTGIVMKGYKQLQKYLAERDDNDEGVDDVVAKLMGMGEEAAELGLVKLSDLLKRKKEESKED